MVSVLDEMRRLVANDLAAQQRPRQIRALWREQARDEQLPPPGGWRVWYVRGGRGAGKTRTGSETLADWIVANPPVDDDEPRGWAIVAPTFGDARSVCAEGPSGIIRALGGLERQGGLVTAWNRSEGIIVLGEPRQHVIYLDGANDGAFRIQGRNLSGLWADEIGLWEKGKWDTAWNESIRFAVRIAPGRIIATGTPKIAHPLIAQLLDPARLASGAIAETHMRTLDNAANLDQATVDDLLATYGGSTLGRQELEGEFIEALEGEILKRADWRYYPKSWSFYSTDPNGPAYSSLPRFTQIVHSWDTAVKDKTTADYYAGQVWGVCAPPKQADRFLLRTFHAHAGFEQAKHAIREFAQWSQTTWPQIPTRIIVEAAGLGPDIVKQLEREIQGLRAVSVKGDKVQRVWAASPALESHNCFLPGHAQDDFTGYEPSQTPSEVQGFVEECAHFRADMKHANDDQVDAWSQMVNWTRARSRQGSISVPSFDDVQPGDLGSLSEW